MDIKTKYDVGDEVFFMCRNKVRIGRIVSLVVRVFECEKTIKYEHRYYISNGDGDYSDKGLFRSKEELLNSL